MEEKLFYLDCVKIFVLLFPMNITATITTIIITTTGKSTRGEWIMS